MLLWRVALGRVVVLVYWRTMIGGMLAVVKGGFSGICRRTQDGGDSRLRGNDGVGDGNGGTQRRKDAMKSRRE